jgi:hypothetical protein
VGQVGFTSILTVDDAGHGIEAVSRARWQ